MTEPSVLVETHGAVRRLVLNRPEQRNALGHATIERMLDLFAEIERDAGVHAVILAGTGKGFSAGADLKEAKNLRDEAAIAAHAELMSRLLLAPWRCSRPVVAEVQGFALGAGLGLALACDAVFCAEDARLAFPEVRHGMVPALVAPSILARVGHARAFEILATGREIAVARAAEWELVKAVPAEFVAREAMGFASEVAAVPPHLVAALKALLRTAGSLDPEAAMEAARGANVAGKLTGLRAGASA
ncbi:enoyl-CoA hydratase/isomerase family protein [uncultured Enterovirga sp.]|uniref:enoyl-CoA hydratase/isomerase family protein n=1 Tax=uncultured Enterovirga sp. TaxID=2026352 RepID=UPI0035C9C51B